jgi:endonuclease YncB( thermonuclease family)
MIRLISFFCISLSLAIVAKAERAFVIDGDTIIIGDITHRLHGIDAPEEGQLCKAGKDGDWPCGKAATDEMVRLLVGGIVSCQSQGNDGYGREISICSLNGKELNHHLVRQGLAWAFRKYSNDYIEEEEQAKSEGVGIWRTQSNPAWAYREEKWQIAIQSRPDGCPIKGDISEQGHIYHVPWSPWYSEIEISEAEKELWFCTEAEAIQAGFRAPIWRYQPTH